MAAFTHVWTGRRSRRSDDQGGFALMVVLFVIMLTSLLVIALIGLSFATAKFSGDQSVRERRARAADAAMEAVVNQITRDPTGNLAFPAPLRADGSEASCTDALGEPDTIVPGGSMTVQGVDVTVECETVQVDDPSDPALTGSMAGIAQPGADDFVRVLGTSNGGDEQSWKTSWPWATFWSDNPGTSTADGYSPAAQSSINSSNATLLHRGAQPLTVAGNLDVSQGAAGLLERPSGQLNGFDNAISVSGQYRQGLPGLLNDIAGRDPDDPAYPAPGEPDDPSATCGVLQPLVGLWKAFNVAIRAGNGLACSQDGGAGEANLLGTTWRTPVATPPAPVLGTTPAQKALNLRWSPTTVAWGSITNGQRLLAQNGRPSPFSGAAQEVPTSCPAAGTVTFVAGAYTKDQTQRLNALWNGSCPNKTWVFAAGDYWFDADSGAGADRHALVIDDPSARIVFGTPVSGAIDDASFPGACTTPGVAITLSERTTIRHAKGRVSICGKDGRTSPAIWQGSNGNLGWNPEISLLTNIGGDFNNANNALALDGTVATADFPCWSPVFQGSTCDGVRTLSLNNVAALDEQAPGSAPVDSVQVLVRGDALNSDAEGARLGLTLTTTGSSPVSCTAWYAGLPDGNQLMSYELLDPVKGNCAGRITDREQLRNAAVALTFDMRSRCALWDLICLNGGAALNVDYVGLRVPWTTTAVSATSVGANGFAPATGVMRPWDNDVAARSYGCSAFSCPGSTLADVRLNNFTDATSPELSSAATAGTVLTSAQVVVSGRAWEVSNGSSYTRLTLTGAGLPSGSCFAQFPGLPGVGATNFQPAAYNLLDAGATGNCAQRLTSASQLVGSSLLVTTYLAKSGSCLGTWVPFTFCGSWGAQIDWVGLSTTSGIPRQGGGGVDASVSYDGPAQPFLVTSNNAPGSTAGYQADAVFNVSGQVSIPRADLNVHWDGPTPIGPSDLPVPGSLVSNPLFSGGGQHALVVGSVTSRSGPNGSVGALCCVPSKPAEREVQLTVHLGGGTSGPIVGTAQVLISDVVVNPPQYAGRWSAGQRTSVRSWNLCGAGVADPADCGPI